VFSSVDFNIDASHPMGKHPPVGAIEARALYRHKDRHNDYGWSVPGELFLIKRASTDNNRSKLQDNEAPNPGYLALTSLDILERRPQIVENIPVVELHIFIVTVPQRVIMIFLING
jgi:hypothetical protein